MPGATAIKTTWLVASHIPIIFPSGEQTSCPSDVQEVEPGVVAAEPDEPLAPAAGPLEPVVEPVAIAVGISVARTVATVGAAVAAAVVADICMVAPSWKTPPASDGAAEALLLDAAGEVFPPAGLPEDDPPVVQVPIGGQVS